MHLKIFPICLFLLFSYVEGKPLSVSTHAQSAILINAETGAILFEKNARKPLYPASLTKIATAAYALHSGEDQLDRLIAAEHEAVATISEEAKERSHYTLPSYWLVPGGSHIGIKKGERQLH